MRYARPVPLVAALAGVPLIHREHVGGKSRSVKLHMGMVPIFAMGLKNCFKKVIKSRHLLNA